MKRLYFLIILCITVILSLVNCPILTEYGLPNTYKLDLIISPAGTGIVNKTPDTSRYDEGTEVKLTAVPNAGYKFINWAGDATGTANPVTVKMNSNKTVTAVFGLLFHTEKIITASDQADGDSFGRSVCMSGDYIIVGAHEARSAYIFKNDGEDNWIETDILTQPFEGFGMCVSISGDYAIVGAIGAGEGDYHGRAYIFKNDGADNWTETAILTASDQADNDFFGRSVSIYGDYAIVGAIGAGEGNYRGQAYIFKNDGADNWTETAILTASDQADYILFGMSVSLYGSYAIVGAYSADSGGNNRGQAYIFKNDGVDNWEETAILIASDQADYDSFGWSVSLYGDYAIVGAYSADSGGNDRGQAYIFKNDGEDNWTETAILTASDQADYDSFGSSVSIYGDYAIIGAPNADYAGGPDHGEAYIFKNDGEDNWTQLRILTASDQADRAYFGGSVYISGNNVVVGATSAGVGGQVYILIE